MTRAAQLNQYDRSLGQLQLLRNTIAKDVDKKRRKMHAALSQLHVLDDQIAALAANETSEIAQIKALLTSGDIRRIETDSDNLVVETRPLRCRRLSDGDIYDIGRLEIRIAPSCAVRIKGLDDKHPFKAHPHADQDGYVCFGNVSDAIYSFWNDGAVAAMLGLMIAFFEHANDDDVWGRSVREWPKVAYGDGRSLIRPYVEVDPHESEDNDPDDDPDDDEY